MTKQILSVFLCLTLVGLPEMIKVLKCGENIKDVSLVWKNERVYNAPTGCNWVDVTFDRYETRRVGWEKCGTKITRVIIQPKDDRIQRGKGCKFYLFPK